MREYTEVEEIGGETTRIRIPMTVNRAVVRKFVESINPDLRVSKEFFETLDFILRERISKAVRRQRSLRGKTLKKDSLYM